MDRWRGEVAIVTGASAGIGAAVVEKLVEEGLQVVGLARRVERIEELSKKLNGKKGKLYAVKADITKEQDILNAFKWVADNLGPVHILINNAGVATQTSLTDCATEKWQEILNTNILGLCIATREAVKVMKENKVDGHIVHISSIVGHGVIDIAGLSVYTASKHAVKALTESLRRELNQAGSGIKISSISPGVVETEIFDVSGLKKNQQVADLLDKVPYLKSEDIANSVLYVLSTPPHVQIHDLIIKPVGEIF